MLDLRILRDLWTEEGARSVFAELVTQCVRSVYSEARQIRPDPGDEGIDTFVGEIGSQLHVWQSKYFCDSIGSTQKAQIRKSWKTCAQSEMIGRVVRWTLCIPIELSTKETKWWQGWMKRESEAWNCQIELWSKSHFVKFSTRPDLAQVFSAALQRGVKHDDCAAALSAMRAAGSPLPLKALPSEDYLSKATFVRKLEAAGVAQHRAARTAFYNFELLRAAIEQGGNPDEVAALVDLQERIYDLWEGAYNECIPSALGRPLFVRLGKLIQEEDGARLSTSLPAHSVHKKGALHYWAELCEAGWTEDFRLVGGREDGGEKGA